MHYLPLTTNHSLLTTYYSLPATYCLLLTTGYSPLTSYYCLLTQVLTAYLSTFYLPKYLLLT